MPIIEADFAMLYSEERKKRIALEDRLHSLIFDTQPFMTAAMDLVYAIAIDQDMKSVPKLLKKVVAWYNDINLNICNAILFPVGDPLIDLSKVDLTKIHGVGDLGVADTTKLVEALNKAAKRVEAQWVKRGICSREESTQSAVRAFQAAMKKAAQSEVVKN